MSKSRTAVVLLVAVVLLAIFVDRSILIRLLWVRTLAPLTLAALVVVAAIGAGFLARRMRLGDPVLDFAVGYPMFGALCFLVGTLRISTATMLPLVLVFAGIGALSMIRGRAGAVVPLHATLVVVFVCAFVWAQAPPVSLDELAYHLAIPHTWVLEGRALDLPLLSHSYFPLGIESADLPLLTMLDPFGGGIASHFLHLAAAIAATTLLFRLTRGNFLATAAIVTTPALAIMAGWSMDDLPLLAVCAALTLALAEADLVTVTAAIAAGLLTKYTFLPFAGIALVVTLMREGWRSGESQALRNRVFRAVAIGAVIGSLFFIRNTILTGNPVAPFFGASAPHVSGYRAPASLAAYVFDGAFVDEALGITLFIPAVLATGVMPWALFILGAALFLLAPSARLLLPFFAIPAAIGGRHLTGRVVKVFVILGIAFQTFLIAHYTLVNEPWAPLAGKYSDEQFVAARRTSYPAIAWLNATLPVDSRTLVIGIQETYWFERKVRGGGNFDSARMSRYLETPTP
ncbi:MAG: hypothetical protein ABI837_16465, partial [Acidobacteriota bacterium]